MQKLILIICCLVFAFGNAVQDKNNKTEKCNTDTSLFVGTVVDTKQAAISEATIVVYVETNNDKNNFTDFNNKNKIAELHSDNTGQFKICLVKGTYRFMVSANGFKKYGLVNYEMNGTTDIRYEFKLEIPQCYDCGEWFPSPQSDKP